MNNNIRPFHLAFPVHNIKETIKQINDIAEEGKWVWDNGTTSGDDNLTDNLCGSNGCPISDATWADNSTRKWNTDEPNDYNAGDPGEDCANITNNNGF